MKATFTARPLDRTTWADLETLFGRAGGSIVRGCWCMYYRKTGAGSASIATAAGNKQQLHDLLGQGPAPGIVGYLDNVPVGWISLGPREDYLKLRRSPVMKPVDDAQVWSIVCTFVDKAHRGLGIQRKLLRAAVDFARDNGVRLLEAYPVDKPERSHDDFMFFGTRSLYEKAGFREVVRRSPTRVVMRRGLRPKRVEPTPDPHRV
jgi:GNAT superfamily N-acetyltransferase